MADRKITELANITGANLADGDEFVVVDASADETKAITFGELKSGLDTATGFVRITGDTMTGNLNFGDNDKAIFGAGSDLQIYHDGSHSRIEDEGQGGLILQGSAGVYIQGQNDENIIIANEDGSVQVYYDNAEKLATTSTGVDITGTLTSDGLTVDGDIRVNTTGTPSTAGVNLVLADTSNASAIQLHNNLGVADGGALLYSSSANNFNVYTYTGAVGSETYINRFGIASGGDISFYEDTGTTAKFFWDASAESLGLGSTSPDSGRKLHIEGGDTTVGITLKDTAGSQYGITNDNNVFTVRNDSLASDRLVIDSSGNVGIGTSSPTFTSAYGGLHVHSTYPEIHLTGTDSGSGASDGFKIQKNSANHVYLWNYENAFMALGTNNAEAMRIDSNGNVGIGVSSGDYKFRVTQSGVTQFILGYQGNSINYLDGDTNIFRNASGSERMRIDSSGRVGLGISSPSSQLHLHTTTTSNTLQLTNSATGTGAGDGMQLISSNSEMILRNREAGPTTFYTNNLERMRIDSSGNLLLNGTATPASAIGSLAIFNGTAPTASVTNGVVLYAQDVSASSELKVRDEAGNVTTLSPHNFDLIPEGASEEMAWSYYSERDGKRINVDMLKAIRLLEQISGEKLVHMV